jgi:small redox-active disulfide protein 2
MQRDYRRILIDGMQVGMFGLERIFEKLRDHPPEDEEELGRLLIKEASAENYISPVAEASYARALVREFKRHRGEEVPDEEPVGLEIIVLGPGCPLCERLHEEVQAYLTEADVDASLEHIKDAKEIARFGMVGTPGLVINRKLKSVGRVPRRAEIEKWIRAALP